MVNLNLPELIPIKQNFPRRGLADIPVTLRQVLSEGGLGRIIKPGQRVAVTAGSRGIANIVVILATIVAEIKKLGAEPRILAAMGSHGGGTKEGRLNILAGLGVTPAGVGAPVDAGDEPARAGILPSGLPLYYNRVALNYDAVILVNRVKPHTSFHGPAESGLQKMVAVGLGGPAGAAALHSRGATALPGAIPAAAKMLLGIIPVVLGVAILEDAHESTAELAAVDPADFGPAESRLLAGAWSLLPRLPVEQLDLLIVDRLGKDISGTGMDTNIIGRLRIQGLPEPPTPVIQRIVALDLSPGTRGNAYGIGLADFTTRSLVDNIDFPATYLNAMTSTFFQRVMLPMTLDTGRAAVEAALSSLGSTGSGGARVARISDTRHLEHLEVSANLLPELAKNPLVETAGPPRPLTLD